MLRHVETSDTPSATSHSVQRDEWISALELSLIQRPFVMLQLEIVEKLHGSIVGCHWSSETFFFFMNFNVLPRKKFFLAEKGLKNCNWQTVTCLEATKAILGAGQAESLTLLLILQASPTESHLLYLN